MMNIRISTIVAIPLAVLACFFGVNSVQASTYGITRSGNMLGLVAHWTFDGENMTNGRLNDISGNSNHGNVISIATSTFLKLGKIGQAGNFDGANDYGTAPNYSPGSSDYSLAVWVKTSATTGTLSSRDDLICIGEAFTNGGSCLSMESNRAKFWLSATPAENLADSVDINDGRWHHIVGTKSGSNTYLYVDGVQKNTGTYAGTVTGATPTIIGRHYNKSESFINGSLDDVRIYGRALSASEVTGLYSQGAGVKQAQSSLLQTTGATGLNSGLAGHWTFDGNDMVNGVMLDKSGNANHGRFINIATSTFFKLGKIGQAGNFDGVNDYVDCGSSGSVLLNSFTFSVWAKTDPSVASTILGLGANTFPMIQLQASLNRPILMLAGSDYRYWSATSPTNLINDKWHHYVFVVTGNTASDIDNALLYVDGVLQTADVTANAEAPAAKSLCKIGVRHTAGTQATKGMIDDARIYNRILTAAEVVALYNQGAGTKQAVSASTQTTGSGGLGSGLVGHWTFDGNNMTNGRLNDISGNGKHGNFMNIATSSFFKIGKVGQGGNFDGVDDHVRVADLTGVLSGTSMTVSAWINTKNIDATHSHIVSFNGSAGTMRRYGDDVMVDTTGLSDNFIMVADALTVNKWFHVVFTYDGTTQAIYVNGANAAQEASSGTITISNATRIGERSGDQERFFGLIDDVRIYNRALSATEVKQLYNNAK